MDVREIESAILACKENVEEIKDVIDKKVFELDRAHYIMAKQTIDICLAKIDEALDCCENANNELVFKEIDTIMLDVKNDCITIKNNILSNIPKETVEEVPSSETTIEEVEEFSTEDVDKLLDNIDEEISLEEQQKVMEDLDRFINEDLDLTPTNEIQEDTQMPSMDIQSIDESNLDAFNLDPITLEEPTEEMAPQVETPMDTTPVVDNEFNFNGIDDNGLDNLFAEEAVDSLRLVA